MYKIAVLGDRDSVLGFKALGLDTYFVEDADEARHTLHRLAKPAAGASSEYAIVYVTEQLAADIAEGATQEKMQEIARRELGWVLPGEYVFPIGS